MTTAANGVKQRSEALRESVVLQQVRLSETWGGVCLEGFYVKLKPRGTSGKHDSGCLTNSILKPLEENHNMWFLAYTCF